MARGEYVEAARECTRGLAIDPTNTALSQALLEAQAKLQAPAPAPTPVVHNDSTVIGIDLGTTFSCVGVWRDGRVEIIANSEGERTTPSWVAFRGDTRIIGAAAKQQASSNPSNTVYDAKRIIGQRFSDSQVQSDVARFPYAVVRGPSDEPLV